MHPMLQKNVDSNYISEEQANYIEKAIENGETIIVSGHRSAGVRVFMATLMAIVKSKYDSVQVKDVTSMEKEARYYLIPGLPESVNFEEVIQTAFNKPGASLVTLKEPEHPYSMLKVMKKALKASGDKSKVVTLLEARKLDVEKDGAVEKVPFLINLNRMFYDEAGKVQKEETPREF